MRVQCSSKNFNPGTKLATKLWTGEILIIELIMLLFDYCMFQLYHYINIYLYHDISLSLYLYILEIQEAKENNRYQENMEYASVR